jgi:hypothetical protein
MTDADDGGAEDPGAGTEEGEGNGAGGEQGSDGTGADEDGDAGTGRVRRAARELG